MKKYLKFLVSGTILIYLSGCSGTSNHNHDHDHDHEHDHNHEAVEEHNHDHDHDHEHDHHHDHDHEPAHEHGDAENDHADSDEIVVKPETAERFGIATDTVSLSPASRTFKVSGRISSSPADMGVVAAPTSGIITFAPGITQGAQVTRGQRIATISSKGMTGGDPNAAAKVALESAKRELDRLKPLYDDGIVSGQDYNAALSAYETAKAAYSSAAASGAATSPISGAIISLSAVQGQFVNAGDPIASVSSNAQMTLTAFIPEKYYNVLPSITDANIRSAYSDEVFSVSQLGGKRVTSSASAAAAEPGYIPVVFTFKNDGRAMSGAMAEVYLIADAGNGADVISIPRTALSEQQGNFFVYVKIDDHGYRKSLVTLGGDDGKNVIVTSGLHPGEEVVVKGTSIVHLAETSGVAPVGHTHNH